MRWTMRFEDVTQAKEEQLKRERPADLWPKLVLVTAGVLTLVWVGVLALGAWSVVDHLVH